MESQKKKQDKKSHQSLQYCYLKDIEVFKTFMVELWGIKPQSKTQIHNNRFTYLLGF